MLSLRAVPMKAGLIAATISVGLAAAGCDDYVKITKDSNVRIHRGQTWAGGRMRRLPQRQRAITGTAERWFRAM